MNILALMKSIPDMTVEFTHGRKSVTMYFDKQTGTYEVTVRAYEFGDTFYLSTTAENEVEKFLRIHGFS